MYKSPDYKFHNVQSPYYASSLLKTPRHSQYDDEEGEGVAKSQKTPQFFSPGKRLFAEEGSQQREELSEISLQLKNKLSSALGKLQQSQQQNKLLSTSKVISDLSPVPQMQIQRANLNLQTLQQSPLQYSPPRVSPPRIQTDGGRQLFPQTPNQHQERTTQLSNSPSFERINIPSPDEETSAHNALMAALSRQQKRRSRSSFLNSSPGKAVSALRRNSATGPVVTPIATGNVDGVSRLPPINMPLKTEVNEHGKDNEQDAILSLMSLSSPQAVKFTHSRSHSNITNGSGSPVSSRASSVAIASPSVQQSGVQLPPISGLMSQYTRQLLKVEDNDETDVEENDEDETDNDDDNDD